MLPQLKARSSATLGAQSATNQQSATLHTTEDTGSSSPQEVAINAQQSQWYENQLLQMLLIHVRELFQLELTSVDSTMPVSREGMTLIIEVGIGDRILASRFI